jgi:hypothetical protein
LQDCRCCIAARTNNAVIILVSLQTPGCSRFTAEQTHHPRSRAANASLLLYVRPLALMQRKKCRSGGTRGTPRSAGCCDCFRRPPRCMEDVNAKKDRIRQDMARYGEAGQDRAEKHKETQQQTWVVAEGDPISRLGGRQGQTPNRQKFRNRKAANACVLRCYQVAQQWLVLTGLCLVCSSGRVRRVCDKLDEGEGTMKSTKWKHMVSWEILAAGSRQACF